MQEEFDCLACGSHPIYEDMMVIPSDASGIEDKIQWGVGECCAQEFQISSDLNKAQFRLKLSELPYLDEPRWERDPITWQVLRA